MQGQGLTVSELNRLLSIVVDVENLSMCVNKEKDPEVKQVYFYLFKVQIHILNNITKLKPRREICAAMTLLPSVSNIFRKSKIRHFFMNI